MANKIVLKKSSVASKVPLAADLDYGELALNYTDGKLYFKNASNAIKSFTIDDSVVTLTGTQTLTNKTLTSPTINGGALSGTFSGAISLSDTTASTSTTTGALTISGGLGVAGSIYADQIRLTNNGNGTNVYIGDDVYLGDINISNTLGIRGIQDATKGYIVFGNANNTNYIGRDGTNPLTVTGQFKVDSGSVSGTNGIALQIAGYASKGGTGYHDFLSVTSTYGSATNPNKFFRLDGNGTLQIINSAYTTNIFNLTDSGVLSIPQISAGGNTGTSGQVLTSTGTGLQWTSAGSGSVTSVALSLPSIFTVSGSPVTTSGTLSATLASQTANTFLAAPNGSAGAPSFRTIVAADIPTLNQNTTGSAASVVGTVTGTNATDLVYGNMADNDQFRIRIGGTATNAGWVELATADDGTEPIYVRQYTGVFATVARTATLLDGSGNTSFPGTVTANGVTLTGNTGTVTSVGGTGTVSGLTLTGTVTTSGNLTLGGTLSVTPSNFASQTANTVLAAPNGSAGTPTFRALVAADIPTLNQNTTGSAGSVANALTIGSYLTGTSYNGSSAVTIAVDATSANTASKVVARDASGNFSAGTITATLSGNASTVTNGVYTTGSYADPAWITSLAKSKVGLGNVENTALSTWAGSTNITTIGAATATSLTVTGDLTITGTTTTINSTTLSVDDKNIELGSVNTPTNTTADGGGITLKGATDKTFNWINATGAWTSSEHIALAAGKDIFLSGATSGTVTLAAADVAGTTTITLPATTGTVVTTGDTSTVTNTMLAGSIANAKLANSSVTVGTTAISLGASSTTLAGLTSVTSTSFVGALTGNASTATTATNQSGGTVAATTGSFSGQITSTVADGTAPMVVTSTTKVANLNVERVDGYHADETNTASSLVVRNASKNIAVSGVVLSGSTSGTSTLVASATAGTTTHVLPSVSGTIITNGDTGSVTSTMILDGTIVNADINASAAIAVSKLAASTISGVTLGNNLNTLTLNVSGTGLSGSTTYNGSAAATFTVTSNATNANTASAIVARDASGNFSAGTITAALSGNATTATTATNLAGGSAGTIPYQSAAGTTAMLAAGTSGYFLKANGAAAPSWVEPSIADMPDAWIKKSVRVATTANITLSATQTIDGIAVVAGDRVLVKDQTTASQNGIYIVAAGAWARSTDADTISKLAGACVNVDSGTVNGGFRFDTDLKATDTLDTTALYFYRVYDTGDAATAATANKLVLRDASGNFNAGSISLTGNLTVSTGNTNGGGIILADDGDIVDLNDGYCALRFSNGVRVYSGNRTGSAVIGLGSNGNITANSVIATKASGAAWVLGAKTTAVSNDSGVWADASNNMQFAARDGSGTLRVIIDSNSSATSYINAGNVAIGATSSSYKLFVNGSFAATTKSFVIDHPTKEGKKLRYGSLEGPENGVYVRGKLKGSSVIELPDYWTKLVDPDSITVNLTCIGKYQKLYVMEIKDNKVYVGNENLWGTDFECFYTVYGERCDVEKLEVEID